MGLGQFMPSSYRNYAKDGDGDGRRDLFRSKKDAFASIANYFIGFGWQTGKPTFMRASGARAPRRLNRKTGKPNSPWPN